ncbi:hypothetical protein BSKO_02360 [Bryopsis sp. KO-2023]|nr:hypothetical protein BSKO_02360 [Bryopsis sp. KO-2023]
MAGLSFEFKKRTTKSAGANKKSVQELPQEDSKQYITVVGEGAGEGSNDDAGSLKIIPALENSFQVGGKKTFVPSFVPEANSVGRTQKGEDRFEIEQVDEKDVEPVNYGLNLREDEGGAGDPKEVRRKPNGKKQRWVEQEAQVYKEDVGKLPDEANPEAYEAMPVSDFGMALLRGMNWKEGDPVGRNKAGKAAVVVEFIPRDSRLGLGAKPSAITAGRKRKHMSKDDMVLAPSADGRVRHVKTIDEKMVPRASLGARVGKKMHVSRGTHAGFDCEVLVMHSPEKGRSERASVRLLVNDEVLSVRVSDLIELSQKKPSKKQRKSEGIEDNKESRSSSSKKKRQGNGKSSSDVQPPEGPSWMFSGIRVRVIDKKMNKGRYYLKKGMVDDVLSPGVANVSMEDSKEVLEAVPQCCLETVIPKKAGGSILVLAGEFVGQQGKLLEKRSDKGVAAVQILEDMSVVRLHLDDIAEYVGSSEDF